MPLSTLLPNPVLRKTLRLAARSRWLVGRLTAAIRTLPDFVIIGVQKGGTTSLYRYLSQHPDVAPALRKEIHFFDHHYHKGLAWYRSFFPTSAACDRHLRATGQRLQTGEATPYYLFHPLVPERMHEVLPGAKLIVVLRDPVSRAYSHYQHMWSRGQEQLSFNEAVEQERDRSRQMFSYVSRGFYASQIREWLHLFERSQFLFLKSEDLSTRPVEILERTGAFLGLSAFNWQVSTRFNQGRYHGEIDPAMKRHLQELYRTQNRTLTEILGKEFNWESEWCER